MKLYKILSLKADHGVSVFPPEDQEFEPGEDLAGEPLTDLINKLIIYGYPPEQARHIIDAWAYHAKYDLNQLPRGVRVFCEMCIKQLPVPVPAPRPDWYVFAWSMAVLAAVVLGLYLWVTLDQELNVTFGAHKWAYLMSYQERLWQGEILNVGTKQMGYYEQGALFGDVVSSHDRNFVGRRGKDWIWIKPGRLVLEGRRILFYHIYRFSGFYVHFCGVMTKVAVGIYKLRQGGDDPYKPWGPWSRPGGRWGTADYEGCWQEFWWL